MLNLGKFYVGQTIRTGVRILDVDPVTNRKIPKPDVSQLTIRFRAPDDSVFATRTLGVDVTDAGRGYYHTSVILTAPGVYTVEYDVGSDGAGDVRGLEKGRLEAVEF